MKFIFKLLLLFKEQPTLTMSSEQVMDKMCVEFWNVSDFSSSPSPTRIQNIPFLMAHAAHWNFLFREEYCVVRFKFIYRIV